MSLPLELADAIRTNPQPEAIREAVAFAADLRYERVVARVTDVDVLRDLLDELLTMVEALGCSAAATVEAA